MSGEEVPKHLIKKEVLGAIPVLVAISFAIGFVFNYEIDPYAEFAIFLSSIGIGLAVGIFVIQFIQNSKTSDVIEKIDFATSESLRILTDKRSVYADFIGRWWLSWHENFYHPFEIFQKFVTNNEDKDEQGSVTRNNVKKNDQAKNTRKNIEYIYADWLHRRRPLFTLMEMVEVYGKDIGRNWNNISYRASWEIKFFEVDGRIDHKVALVHFREVFDLLTDFVDSLIKYMDDDIKKELQKQIVIRRKKVEDANN